MANLVQNNRNKNTIQLASHLSTQIQDVLIKTAFDASVHHKYNTEIIDNVFKSVDLDTEDSLDLIGLFIAVTNIFLHSDEKQFWEALSTAGFTDSFIKNFLAKYKTSITCLSNKHIPKMSGFKWRIDISFASGFLDKKVPYTVIINLQLSSGEKCVFEIDLKTFHKLRFNVALALKEMNSLEKLSLVKNMKL